MERKIVHRRKNRYSEKMDDLGIVWKRVRRAARRSKPRQRSLTRFTLLERAYWAAAATE